MIAGLETSGGMSRSEIAECTRLSKPIVWRLATGSVRKPTYSSVVKVERLHCPGWADHRR
jgi:hypothetical protein